MKELQITVEDLKGKIKHLQLQILKDKFTTFKIRLNKQQSGRAISDEERKVQTD